MIKHVVCFKLKDNSPENCEKAKEQLQRITDLQNKSNNFYNFRNTNKKGDLKNGRL